MALDLANIQKALVSEGLDGWLWYDFHGSNPIAVNLAGLSGKHTTRRWYYFIPSKGTPRKLVHAIEPFMLDGLPGEKQIYAGRLQLEEGVSEILRGSRTIAMEYSPECAIPYLSRIDAGTVDFIRRLGMSVVSSGDLVGRFEAAWNAEQIATHRAASEKLYRVKDRAFDYVGAKLTAGDAIHEYEVQQQMVGWFREEGLVADTEPIVAAQENAGNPHYAPTRESSRPIRPDELLLLDLWGKLDKAGSVYADITWTGFAGDPPDEIARAFAAIVAGRDAAIAKVRNAVAAGQAIRGWEVDRVTRDVITEAGFGKFFIHRTGHSLGEEVHGNGVHMDDYETHDDRRLVTGTGFTIEPGVYTPTFGVRTEINMVVGEHSADVTGPCQQTLVRIHSFAKELRS
jgi:Xaa-Pro aminopeptidase